MEQLRRTRLVLAEIRNGLRGPGEEGYVPADIFELPGDELLGTPGLTPEEVEAIWAELDARDKDLIPATPPRST